MLGKIKGKAKRIFHLNPKGSLPAVNTAVAGSSSNNPPSEAIPTPSPSTASIPPSNSISPATTPSVTQPDALNGAPITPQMSSPSQAPDPNTAIPLVNTVVPGARAWEPIPLVAPATQDRIATFLNGLSIAMKWAAGVGAVAGPPGMALKGFSFVVDWVKVRFSAHTYLELPWLILHGRECMRTRLIVLL